MSDLSARRLVLFQPAAPKRAPPVLTLPGRGTVADDFVVDRFRAAFGDLFFEAPTGAWEEGTYMLVLEHEGVRAAVPIELE